MKYLLYDCVGEEVLGNTSATYLAAIRLDPDNGLIYRNSKDFEEGFNSEDFSTATHFLKVANESDLFRVWVLITFNEGYTMVCIL